MTCPDCEGFGFVAGELAGGRVKCLRCSGSGHIVNPRLSQALESDENELVVPASTARPSGAPRSR
jgi:hypothetical protein